jgi:hypothetical protein
MLIGIHTGNLLTNPRFASELLLVKRGAGSYVDGIYTEGAEETTELVGSAQPISPDDRENYDFGERVIEARVFYIKGLDKGLIRPMRQGDSTNTRGDVIRENAIDYEVYSVESFYLNQHIKCIAVRREDQPDA